MKKSMFASLLALAMAGLGGGQADAQGYDPNATPGNGYNGNGYGYGGNCYNGNCYNNYGYGYGHGGGYNCYAPGQCKVCTPEFEIPLPQITITLRSIKIREGNCGSNGCGNGHPYGPWGYAGYGATPPPPGYPYGPGYTYWNQGAFQPMPYPGQKPDAQKGDAQQKDAKPEVAPPPTPLKPISFQPASYNYSGSYDGYYQTPGSYSVPDYWHGR